MLILSTKLKNQFKNKNYTIQLKNININGAKRGCSGFIKNNLNNKVVYVNTEDATSWLGMLYREAESMRDYYGKINHFAKSLKELCDGINKLLN